MGQQGTIQVQFIDVPEVGLSASVFFLPEGGGDAVPLGGPFDVIGGGSIAVSPVQVVCDLQTSAYWEATPATAAARRPAGVTGSTGPTATTGRPRAPHQRPEGK